MMNYRSRRNSSEIHEERCIFPCGLRSMTVQLDDEWDLTIPRMAERTLGNMCSRACILHARWLLGTATVCTYDGHHERSRVSRLESLDIGNLLCSIRPTKGRSPLGPQP